MIKRIDEFKLFHLPCACYLAEHEVRLGYITYDVMDESDVGQQELYVTHHMNYGLSFWRRVWLAIKYVFKSESRYGHFDEAIVSRIQVTKLKEFLEQFERDSKDEDKRLRTPKVFTDPFSFTN